MARPLGQLDAAQREADMRLGEAIAQAERAAGRGPEEAYIVYAATSVPFQHRHELPSDVPQSLADSWMCASAARFGAPFETWWPDDQDGFYRTRDTAQCKADPGPYPEPWEDSDWDPGADR